MACFGGIAITVIGFLICFCWKETNNYEHLPPQLRFSNYGELVDEERGFADKVKNATVKKTGVELVDIRLVSPPTSATHGEVKQFESSMPLDASE